MRTTIFEIEDNFQSLIEQEIFDRLTDNYQPISFIELEAFHHVFTKYSNQKVLRAYLIGKAAKRNEHYLRKIPL